MTDATTLVIFGAGGDLTSRLLLPALGQLLTREPSRTVRVVGADREELTDADFQTVVRSAFATVDAQKAASRVEVEYRRTDITSAEDLTALFGGFTGQVALYFAVPPSVAEKSVQVMTAEMLPEGAVLVMEKPFGIDEASARTLNRTLTSLVPENQVFRVDHFLGKSTTLNLLGARFANRLLEPLWTAESIESVDIVYDEALALEGRAGYYDGAGALVDMIQSHLLQVLAVLAMDEPATLDEIDFREATSAVLRATSVWGDDPVSASRRARYTAGNVQGIDKPSYVDEPGVDPERGTETLAEATFEVRNARWAGVPFRLRSGKALSAPATEIVVRFRAVRHVPAGLTGSADGAVLRFSLGPDRVSLELNLNAAEDPFELERATLSAELGEGALKAYAEVLSGILDGDPLLAVRGDAAEQCWRIVEPILKAWRRGDVPLEEYAAGSFGPEGWSPRH
ncbi:MULTISPECIES: glucose-6-phosphate dehydrogenase [unclassified Microbacterium]|uniref:glucose-6-phosphate dehydrogenase n=1 Tax=unclassified Microbacterium TaxID=2609290 RepID=UPI000EAA6768|nr:MULTISPECIES: glucose-6-phosphate dehydrogenase [unclassified Microbacterium]MBT2483270.1 glucose-6-phosphate dehydrogenase [Microbacterium sp. ISL-108]RKN69378.1 glucose-6-phosphate dehydrogenase [Microbacterium sp. CGR2]